MVSADFIRDGDQTIIEVAIVPANHGKGLVVVTIDGATGEVSGLREPGGSQPLWLDPPHVPQESENLFTG